MPAGTGFPYFDEAQPREGGDKPHEAIARRRGRDGVGLQNIGFVLSRVGDGGGDQLPAEPFAPTCRRTYMQVSDQTCSPGSSSGPPRLRKVSRGATDTQATGSPSA